MFSIPGENLDTYLWMGVTTGYGKSCRYFMKNRVTNEIVQQPVTLYTVPLEKKTQQSEEISFHKADLNDNNEQAEQLATFSGYYMANFNEQAAAVTIMGKMVGTSTGTSYAVEIGQGNLDGFNTVEFDSEFSFSAGNLYFPEKTGWNPLVLQRIFNCSPSVETITIADEDGFYLTSTCWNPIPFTTFKDRSLSDANELRSLEITENKDNVYTIKINSEGYEISTSSFKYDLLNQVVTFTFEDSDYTLFFYIDGERGYSCRIQNAPDVFIVSEVPVQKAL